MRINKNLDLNGLYKCCRKVCTCNISLKIINDIVKGQNVILLNKVAKISVYIYIHTQGWCHDQSGGFKLGVSIRVSVSGSCRVEVGVFD